MTTYTSADVPKAIPDQSTVTSTMTVADAMTIDDLNVMLDISHTNDSDLDLFLIAPDGTRVELFSDVGGGGDHFTGTILEDEAATPITVGSAPFSGSFQPEGSLSDFDGKDSQGTWTLELTDDKRRKEGMLNGWSIEITPANPVVLPSISIDDVQLDEGDSGTTAFVFTVSRSGDTSGSSSVDFDTADGTANQGIDFIGTSGTLTFPANDSNPQTITVQVSGDTDVELDETFFVDLSGATGSMISDSQGQGTITSDDIPPPTLSISDGSIAEEGAFETFVTAGSGGLDTPRGLVFGPDGNFYVASHNTDQVLRYSGTTGAFTDVFVPAGSGGLDRTSGLAFGPDGSLYVVSAGTDSILRFQGPGGALPGAFVDEFVATGSGGLDNPHNLVFGANGNLYVTSRLTDNVLRYEGPAGVSPGALIDEFVTAGSGGLDGPTALVFGPDDNLYVGNASHSQNLENVLRFQGPNGISPGGFVDEFVAAGSGGLDNPFGLAFGPTGDLHVSGATSDNVLRFQGPDGVSPGALVYEAAPASTSGLDSPDAVVFDLDGNLYVSSRATDEVLKYSQGVTATLSSPSDVTVTVDFATSDGSATAGDDYAALNRTLTFAPGETTKTILLAAIDDLAFEADETFTVTLSNPTGDATIADNQGVATITDDDSLRQVTINDVTATEGDDSIHFRGQFVTPASGGLNRPREMTFGPDGHLYVTSDSSDQVFRYDETTGAFIDEFVSAQSGGLDRPFGITFGPDGNLYVSSDATDEVLRYDGTSGAFLDVFASNVSGPAYQGPYGPGGLTFGPDGNLYVTTQTEDTVVRFDGTTGQLIDVFVASGSGGLRAAKGLTFGPDGNLYVASFVTNNVLRFDGSTGAFIDAFVTSGSGGLHQTEGVTFGPDGSLYVVSFGSDEVLRYDGVSGEFIERAADGIDAPIGITFDSSGNFYVGSTITSEIHRYGTTPEAVLTVTISTPSSLPITVDYTTADGTAKVLDGDYTSTSGTVTFAPGVTNRTILVPTVDDAVLESTESFFVNLSAATGAVISDNQGTATILDDDAPLPSTKFFVVDSGADQTFEYDSGGTALTGDNWNLDGGNTNAKGATSITDGSTVWVVDKNDKVYVYDGDGGSPTSWTAVGLNEAEGIATDAVDIWILDKKAKKVLRYNDAATTGDANVDFSFSLYSGNNKAKGITTDGSSLWVVNDDRNTDKVFKYDTSGNLEGSWTIDSANSKPTGITIDPSGASTSIWIVDGGTDAVYEYGNALGNSGGSLVGSFALAGGNTNPQGIADPPAPAESNAEAIPALDVGLVPLIKKRSVVDRDTEASVAMETTPLVVPKLPANYSTTVDAVIKEMVTSRANDGDDEEDLSDALEDAIQELVVVPRLEPWME